MNHTFLSASSEIQQFRIILDVWTLPPPHPAHFHVDLGQAKAAHG